MSAREPLLRGGIALIVEAVELERREDRRDVASGGDDPGLIGSLEHSWDDQRREDPEDHDDDQHLDQRETGRGRAVMRLRSGTRLILRL